MFYLLIGFNRNCNFCWLKLRHQFYQNFTILRMLCNSEVRMTKIAWNAAIVLQHAMHEFSVEGGGGFIITSPL
jgi:hypothetical protein